MNAADPLAYETAVEDQRQRRQRTEQPKKNDEALRRRVAPELRYRTTITEQPTVTVTAPEVAADETVIWWQWVDQRLAAQAAKIERDIAAHFNLYDEAAGTALGMKCHDVREDLERKINFLKRDLEQAQSKINAQAELEREREALRARAVEADHAERESLRREIALLREQIGLERGLRTLRGEVEAARAKIPNFNALEARFEAKQAGLKAEQARLQRELKTTRDRLATLRAQHSETQYKLTQMEDEQQKPGIELKFETQQSSFTLRDMHPDAAAAWKRFVAGVLESPQDETATMLLIDPAAGTA